MALWWGEGALLTFNKDGKLLEFDLFRSSHDVYPLGDFRGTKKMILHSLAPCS